MQIFLSAFPNFPRKNAIFSASRRRTRLIFGHKKSKLKKNWCQPPPLRGRKLAPNNVFPKNPKNHNTVPQQTTLFEKYTCDFSISKAS